MTRKEEEKLVKIFKALDKKIKAQHERKELYLKDCGDQYELITIIKD